jgi:hypothetical protein
MNFQVDGKATLAQQEMQLQALETFFVEIIDYEAGADIKNDVMVKNISVVVSAPIKLQVVQAPTDLAKIGTDGSSIVFDRSVYVEGVKTRVLGVRAKTAEKAKPGV